MDPDLILVAGLILACLSVPAILSAFSDSRPMRGGALLFLFAAGLIGVAVMMRPGGYAFDEIPDVFFGVVARFLP